MHQTQVLAIIMAKYPEPGRVKTRLVGPGVSPEMAAGIAEWFLSCITRRLRRVFGSVALVVSPDERADELAGRLGCQFDLVCGQGEGDLGKRLARVWKSLPRDQPVAFFGMDSPDIPVGHLERIAASLVECQLGVGATADGGYWTLACRRYLPEMLDRIDWGSSRVYDQTLERAEEAGLGLAQLPAWFDVDDRADLDHLWARLARAAPDDQDDQELRDLTDHLGGTGLFDGANSG